MKHYVKKHLLLASVTMALFSCSGENFENEPIVDSDNAEITPPPDSFDIVDGVLEFQDEQSLKNLLENTEDTALKSQISALDDIGFQSLRPMVDIEDDLAVAEYLKDKASKIKKEGFLYSRGTKSDDLDLEDELIQDVKFTSVLNHKRQIVVGDNFYMYTTNGLYFCHKTKRETLKRYLKEIGQSDKNMKLPERDCEKMLKGANDGGLALSAPQGKTTQVTDIISLYSACGGGGGGGSGGGTGGGGTSSSANGIEMIVPQNFTSCFHDENGIWQSLFGDTTKCNAYHDDTHRVQTKFWNQNYLIYASIGYRVKYQKKRFIGWSESKTADYVEIGVNHVKYTYSYPNVVVMPDYANNTFFTEYGGVTYDAMGNISSYDAGFSLKKWPFKNDKDALSVVAFTLFNNPNNYTLATYGDVNYAIKELLKTASKQIPKLAADLEDNNVEVQITSASPGKIEFITANRLSRRKSNFGQTLDFNFLFSIGAEENTFVGFILRQLNGKKYQKVSLDIYGLAKRNGVITGRKIYGKSK